MNIHTEIPNTGAPTIHLPSRSRRPSGAKPATPQLLVQMILDKALNKEDAIAAVIDAAEHNAFLQSFLLNKGARAAVGELIRNDNAKIFTGNTKANVAAPLRMTEAPLVSPSHKRRLRKAADTTLQLLGILLPNGVRMSEARHEDLLHAVNHYEPQALDMLHKAKYLKSVMRELPKDKAVSEVMDDAALTVLFNQARAE